METMDVTAVYQVLETVKDPEIPVLSIVDMAMVSGVELKPGNEVAVRFIPTFVGCPALGFIKNNITEALLAAGFSKVEVVADLKNRWRSDLMQPEAKAKLEKFGIAPPVVINDEELTPEQLDRVRCPHCKSTDTTLRSAFGSTLCRAIRFCYNCKQGFEQFKPVQ